MAPPDWYLDWATDYVASLGITNPEWIETIMQRWWPAFARIGYTQADMTAATAIVISGTETPNWLREHLAAIKKAVAQARYEAPRPKAERPAEGQPCYFCDWTAWVIVPHPAWVRGGEWKPNLNRLGDPVWVTCAVACTRCAPGLRHEQKLLEWATSNPPLLRGGAPLTLDNYEKKYNPAWRDHLAEQEEAKRAMNQTDDLTAAVDGANLAVLTDRIINRVRQFPDSTN